MLIRILDHEFESDPPSLEAKYVIYILYIWAGDLDPAVGNFRYEPCFQSLHFAISVLFDEKTG
jgi:hypothetical protein